MRLYLYSVACTPLTSSAGIKKSWGGQYEVLLSCVDEQGRTHMVQITEYNTGFFLLPKQQDMQQVGMRVTPKSFHPKIEKKIQRIELIHDARMLLGFTSPDVQSLPSSANGDASSLTREQLDACTYTKAKHKTVIRVFLKNESDRYFVTKVLRMDANMYLSNGLIRIKEFLHEKISPEIQFLYDSGLKLQRWFEVGELSNTLEGVGISVVDQGVSHQLASSRLLISKDVVQGDAPKLRKMYIRAFAHSSTATQTNQFAPSEDIDEDRVQFIAYHTNDTVTPVLLDIADYNNDEKQLLKAFADVMLAADVHVLVFASDEQLKPNCLVYLFKRAERCHINLHFSKLSGLQLSCKLTACGDSANNFILNFKHPGVERVDLCSVLAKAMVSPPLDGMTLLDALRHPKLIQKKNKPQFAKLSHLNYHGVNNFSSADKIREDLATNVSLLRTLECDNEFVASQQNISSICNLDLTSVSERGQQARVRNLFVRTYHDKHIFINTSQVKKQYIVVKRDRKDSNYPDAPWLNNPPVESMRGETRPRHIIRQRLPPHLKSILDLPHNNLFDVIDEEDIEKNPPPPPASILVDPASLPNLDEQQEKEEEEDDTTDEDEPQHKKSKTDHLQQQEEEGCVPPPPPAPATAQLHENLKKRAAEWWENHKASDFERKSKTRKKAPGEDAAASKKRYSGGLVLKPEKGFYTKEDEAAGTFDFGSLYPSIIEGFLLCYMRVLYKRKWLTNPDLELEYVPITETECLVLAKSYRGVPVETITPAIVHDIVQLRQGIRTKQKDFKEGSFEWMTLERAQLAAKVVQNSVYGFVGSATSGMTCTALAAAVTQIGQWMNRTIRFIILFVGGFIYYGDTDSVMARFWVAQHLKTTDEIYGTIYEQCFIVQKYGTALFPKPNKLEFEAVKKRFLLYKKKTYAAVQMSAKKEGWKLPVEDKPNIKGLTLKKRDKCYYAQRIGYTLLNRLLYESNSMEENAAWFKKELESIPKGKLKTIEQLSSFMITCSLGHEYKKKEGVLALHLADMIAKETGAIPRPGTRLAYVVANGKTRLHCHSCETPDHFLHLGHNMDIGYYLGQILKCVNQILCLPVHEALKQCFTDIVKRFVNQWNNKETKCQEITSFFSKNVAKTHI